MNRFIDLNCDMGEGLNNDALLMPLISSANIACGYHAGDSETMKKTVELALKHHVAIGAHPGFKDKINFGRLEISITLPHLFDTITEQIYLLKKITDTFGVDMHHIKPHGALYNMAARDSSMARTIAAAVKSVDSKLILYGLSGSFLISEAAAVNLRNASETFADRSYQSDGSLTPRSLPGALIEHTEKSIAQVLQMVLQKTVTTHLAETIPINAETICIHGDGKKAVVFAEHIRKKLIENKITIQTI
jgi:5-oxoprolinase (ATP-hydrolysing) subunit A